MSPLKPTSCGTDGGIKSKGVRLELIGGTAQSTLKNLDFKMSHIIQSPTRIQFGKYLITQAKCLLWSLER